MPEMIISDTSCLLVFTNAGQLTLLRDLFHDIVVTGVVASEYRLPIPAWIHVIDPSDPERYEQLREVVDAGEASAIALALEHKGVLVLMDDLKGRRLAAELGVLTTGSLGVLKKAKDKSLIPAMRPFIEQLQQAGLWVSPDLVKAVLAEVGE